MGADAHGMGTDAVAADWPAMTQDDLTRLLAHYPALGKLQARHWRSPRPFSCAEIIATEHGSLFVKRYHHRVRQPEGLIEEHRFMTHLAEQGIPVPHIYRSLTGDSALRLGDWTYEIHGLSSGEDWYRDTRSWEPFHSADDARAAGAMLARCHIAAADYQAPCRRQQPLIANLRLFSQKNPLEALQRHIAGRPALMAYFADKPWRQTIDQHILPWHRKVFPYLAQQKPLWTHNDWHASNLLWRRTPTRPEVACVIDFGLSDRTFALFDLATAIERNAIAWLSLTPAHSPEADLSAVTALLAGYREHLALTDTDLLVLSLLLPIVHADFALSELDYFADILKNRTYADLAWFDYLFGHAAWFSQPAGQRLLRHIRTPSRRRRQTEGTPHHA
ncbi:phosphotransferase [Affinibrenneria salicis]|uniref:Phosphotransferase n=2 Tax=Affinibrenneria salicis TaxID=2590031 RepID=A0A5J5FSA7_9GAMM|nr:phosphotransferase [Affinibrenneria salicis]